MNRTTKRLIRVYEKLMDAFGPQGWWPSEGPFETIVGAVLTQHTSWRNAERALAKLRAEGLLSYDAMFHTPAGTLERLFRSAGQYRRKAQTLTHLMTRIEGLPGRLSGLLSMDPELLRAYLLETRGIGPETADTVVLYAAGQPSFIAGEYTRRFAVRHGLVDGGASYEEVRSLFQDALPRDRELYGEFHALLVCLGKRHCRRAPRCVDCPIAGDLPHDGPVANERGGGDGSMSSNQ
jgi:endonuclease-3 related protein